MSAQPIQPGHQAASSAVKLDEHGLPEGYPLKPDWEVTPRLVKAMLDAQEDLVLIDCRTPQEHQVARIDQGVLIPMQELASRMDELAPHAESKVVVFCHRGGRSLRVTAMLREHGFDDVYSMAGGIDLWALDVEPSTPRY